APGVLQNDTDVDNNASLNHPVVPQTLNAAIVTPPAASQGTVNLGSNGGFTFTPSPGFFGQASFSYRATDQGGLSSTANVFINVSNNPPPVAVNDSYSVTEDTPR